MVAEALIVGLIAIVALVCVAVLLSARNDNGERRGPSWLWVPPTRQQQPDRQSSARGPVIVLIIVILSIAIFYFGWYDTPAQRCARGDLGACLVVR